MMVLRGVVRLRELFLGGLKMTERNATYYLKKHIGRYIKKHIKELGKEGVRIQLTNLELVRDLDYAVMMRKGLEEHIESIRAIKMMFE